MAEGQFMVPIGEDKGIAGERNGLLLMEKFRAALRNPSLRARYITQRCDNDHPVSEQVWRKALLWACASGQMEYVSQFMNSSPFQSLVHSARDEDETPLHRAVLGGHLEINRLQSHIAYYPFLALHSKTKKKGLTALNLAVYANNLQTVDLLVKWYENINQLSSRLCNFVTTCG
ncbi:hypothetical protein R1flu_012171 [Riccia fluitans]|uniref:Uncharacterized protein n=1 Tax=Riccia fluitans TaxID=41844 RepID=A0ABD1ZCB3_9MARC